MTENLICEAVDEKVRVVRFLRPDVRDALYHEGHDHADIGGSDLYQELHRAALADLPDRCSLVVNFGHVDAFSSAFYRLLLKVLQDVRAKGGRLLLCCFTEYMREAFAVMGGPKTFAPVHPTEARAIQEAKK
jgi:anti-anti-sigma regulatory factor